MAFVARVLPKQTKILYFGYCRMTADSFSRRALSNVPDNNRPVKFTTSKAASWNARSSRGDIKDDSPWFQPYVVLSSVAVFMLYFCVFREENDVDQELTKTLYDRIPGLEKKQLEIVLDYNESQGIDTTAIRNRLLEIENEKIPD